MTTSGSSLPPNKPQQRGRDPRLRRLSDIRDELCEMSPAPPVSCWLMKAEPESRIVKGQDVKVGATVSDV
jgi:hypothetical protein